MRPCQTCGMRVNPAQWPQHSYMHVQQARIPVDQEAYWRERVAQEITGEAISTAMQARQASHHYIEGLEAAAAIAMGQ